MSHFCVVAGLYLGHLEFIFILKAKPVNFRFLRFFASLRSPLLATTVFCKIPLALKFCFTVVVERG